MRRRPQRGRRELTNMCCTVRLARKTSLEGSLRVNVRLTVRYGVTECALVLEPKVPGSNLGVHVFFFREKKNFGVVAWKRSG